MMSGERDRMRGVRGGREKDLDGEEVVLRACWEAETEHVQERRKE